MIWAASAGGPASLQFAVVKGVPKKVTDLLTDTIWPKSAIWGPDLDTKMVVYCAFELKS